MNEEVVKHQIQTDAQAPINTQTEEAAAIAAAGAASPPATAKQYEEQLLYAQKLLQILQGKLNDANGINIQLEAKLQLAEEKNKEG